MASASLGAGLPTRDLMCSEMRFLPSPGYRIQRTISRNLSFAAVEVEFFLPLLIKLSASPYTTALGVDVFSLIVFRYATRRKGSDDLTAVATSDLNSSACSSGSSAEELRILKSIMPMALSDMYRSSHPPPFSNINSSGCDICEEGVRG